MIIYGVDLDKSVTPEMVRDALKECFYVAHCEDTGLDETTEKDRRGYCETLVKDMFAEVGGDFEHPTKDMIMKVIAKLEIFSKNFRDPELVKKHAGEIMMIVDKLS